MEKIFINKLHPMDVDSNTKEYKALKSTPIAGYNTGDNMRETCSGRTKVTSRGK